MLEQLLNFIGVEPKSKSRKNIVLSAVIGCLLGGGLALLFSPKSGKENRKMLKKVANTGAEKGKELAQTTEEKLKDAAAKIKEISLELAENAKNKFKKAQKEAEEVVDEAKEKAEAEADKKSKEKSKD